MKRGNCLSYYFQNSHNFCFSKYFLTFLIIIASLSTISLAEDVDCDLDPWCVEDTRECGCGGTQIRHTLCQGGCSEWEDCSVMDTEQFCDDEIDNDCDGLMDCTDPDCVLYPFCIDNDGDSFPSNIDCNDDDPNINPGADEICNNIDDDCNRMTDDNIERVCGESEVGACTFGFETCEFGTWTDCSAIFPSVELCDAIDNNCDGVIDEGCSCHDGETQSCGSNVGECRQGIQTCNSGSWSDCVGEIQPKNEICENGLDDNCDGVVDEGCFVEIPETADMLEEFDSISIREASDNASIVTDEPEPRDIPRSNLFEREPKEVCIDNDGDNYGINCPAGNDCNDNAFSVNPSAKEICNNIDDNCNNEIDESLQQACGQTDVGICSFGIESCDNGKWVGCSAIMPKTEICENNVDDNCNGIVDTDCEDKDELSKEEIRLKQFLDLKHLHSDYDLGVYVDQYRKTKPYINTQLSSKIIDGNTEVKIKIIPIKDFKDFTIFVYIPKEVANSVNDIIFSEQPEVIQEDPLVAYHFASVNAPKEITYKVKGEHESAHDLTKTISLAKESIPHVMPWYFKFMPLFFIPIIGIVFAVLLQLLHRRQ